MTERNGPPAPLDPRIGVLCQDGVTVYYAFAHGYGQPETVGTRAEIEAALDTGAAPEAEPSAGKSGHRGYIVTMSQGEVEAPLRVAADDAASAISKARDFWNLQDGHTRTVGLLPRRFRARLATDADE